MLLYVLQHIHRAIRLSRGEILKRRTVGNVPRHNHENTVKPLLLQVSRAFLPTFFFTLYEIEEQRDDGPVPPVQRDFRLLSWRAEDLRDVFPHIVLHIMNHETDKHVFTMRVYREAMSRLGRNQE